MVNVLHQFSRFLFADVFVQRATKVVCDVVLAVGECACAAEAAHNRTRFALNAGFNFITVNRAFALCKFVARLKHGDFKVVIFCSEFVGGKNSARTCANNNYIIVKIFHFVFYSLSSVGINSYGNSSSYNSLIWCCVMFVPILLLIATSAGSNWSSATTRVFGLNTLMLLR